MATAVRLSEEAEQKIAEIVRQDLSSRFGDRIIFDAIRITPEEDEFGDPYHRIVVIYTGDGELLDPSWLNGFRRRNQDRLAEWGVDITSESYVDQTLDGPWSDMISTAPSEETNE